jgi:MATE family, multidrug efflux pump
MRRQKRDLTQGPLSKTLVRLAAPMGIAVLLQTLYSMVDLFWLGKFDQAMNLGGAAFAAPGVSLPIVFVAVSFSMGFAGGASALVAQLTGAGETRRADHAATQMMLLLGFVALPFMAILVIFTEPVLQIMRVPDDVIIHAVPYLRIFLLDLPIACAFFAYGASLRAFGDTMTMLILGIISNVVNCCLDPILIFGYFGFPSMGTAGAALATLISRLGVAVCCIVLLRRGHAGLRVTRADLRPDWEMQRTLLHIGLPAGISLSNNAVGFAVFQIMVNDLGPSVIGAFAIGVRFMRLMSIPGHSLASAAAAVVGQALGAGKPELARRAIWWSVTRVTAVMMVPVLVIVWQGENITRLFNNDPAIVAEGTMMFRLVPLSALVFSALIVLTAAFIGSGHSRTVLGLSIVRQWVLRLPLCWTLCFVLGWGSMGIYGGMALANVIGAILTLWLFLRGRWLTGVVEKEK